MAQRRVNITIDTDLHDEAKQLLAKMPGATFSGLVEDTLRDMLPMLNAMVDAFQTGGEVAAARAVEAQLGRALMGAIHTHAAEKEDSQT